MRIEVKMDSSLFLSMFIGTHVFERNFSFINIIVIIYLCNTLQRYYTNIKYCSVTRQKGTRCTYNCTSKNKIKTSKNADKFRCFIVRAKLLRVLKSSACKLFQTFMTRSQKKHLTRIVEFFLNILYLCPVPTGRN